MARRHSDCLRLIVGDRTTEEFVEAKAGAVPSAQQAASPEPPNLAITGETRLGIDLDRGCLGQHQPVGRHASGGIKVGLGAVDLDAGDGNLDDKRCRGGVLFTKGLGGAGDDGKIGLGLRGRQRQRVFFA